MREIIIAMMPEPPMTDELQATERYCINKINIVKDCSVVTVIGQIKPWGIFKTKKNMLHEIYRASTSIIATMNPIWPRWSMPRRILWYCQKKGEPFVWCSLLIGRSGWTGRDDWKQHCDNSKTMQESWRNAIFQGNLDFIFLSLWVQ